MAVVLALNRYTALYKPTKHDAVETRGRAFCMKTPLQLWSNKRKNLYVMYCLLTCLIGVVGAVLAKPYFRWQTRQFESVGNVTTARIGAREPSMLVSNDAVDVEVLPSDCLLPLASARQSRLQRPLRCPLQFGLS